MNDIFDTLFGLLKDNVQGVKTWEQKARMFDHVAPEEQPYIGMVMGSDTPTYQRGAPIFWERQCTFYLYSRDTGDDTGARNLRLLTRQIKDAMAFDNPNNDTFTVRGACVKCEIGQVMYDEGVLGEQAVAVLTAKITQYGN